MIPRDILHKDKGASLLVAMFNIELYTELGKKFEPDVVKQKLRQLGQNIAKGYYEFYKPSSSSISGLAREIARQVGGIHKLKLKKLDDGFILSSPDCPLCVSGLEVEELKNESQGNVPVCIPTMAILEEFINLTLQNKPQKFRYKQVIGEVVKSKSLGDAFCEYNFRLIEK